MQPNDPYLIDYKGLGCDRVMQGKVYKYEMLPNSESVRRTLGPENHWQGCVEWRRRLHACMQEQGRQF